MRALLAYAPALAILCVGIVAVVAIPSTQHPIPCNCSTGTICSCAPPGNSENVPGAPILLACVFGALLWAMGAWVVRGRTPGHVGL